MTHIEITFYFDDSSDRNIGLDFWRKVDIDIVERTELTIFPDTDSRLNRMCRYNSPHLKLMAPLSMECSRRMFSLEIIMFSFGIIMFFFFSFCLSSSFSVSADLPAN